MVCGKIPCAILYGEYRGCMSGRLGFLFLLPGVYRGCGTERCDCSCCDGGAF